MFDAKDGNFQFEVFEGVVRAYSRESFGEIFGRGVCGEGFNRRVGGGGAKGVGERGEVVGITSEEGNSEVPMGRVGKYTCYASALQLKEAVSSYTRGLGELTVVGPAPIRIARPDGAILDLTFAVWIALGDVEVECHVFRAS